MRQAMEPVIKKINANKKQNANAYRKSNFQGVQGCGIAMVSHTRQRGAINFKKGMLVQVFVTNKSGSF